MKVRELQTLLNTIHKKKSLKDIFLKRLSMCGNKATVTQNIFSSSSLNSILSMNEERHKDIFETAEESKQSRWRVFMKTHGTYTLPSYDQKTVLAINIHIIDIIAYLSNSCPLNFQTRFDIHSTVAFKSTDPLVLRCHNVGINKLRKLFFFSLSK